MLLVFDTIIGVFVQDDTKGVLLSAIRGNVTVKAIFCNGQNSMDSDGEIL